MSKKLPFLCAVVITSALSLPRIASATAYTISFAGATGSLNPALASPTFSVDALGNFSNFVIEWDGLSFDFDGVSANGNLGSGNPSVIGAPSCAGSSPYGGLASIGCLTASGASLGWNGSVVSAGGGTYQYTVNLNIFADGGFIGLSEALYLNPSTTPAALGQLATGSFTVADVTSAPEPRSLAFTLIGFGSLVLMRKRRVPFF
jgi:hypothetical protein